MRYFLPGWAALTLLLVLGRATAAMEPSRPETLATPDMTPERMLEIVMRIDEDAQHADNVIEFAVEDHTVLIVFDEAADRMRMMVAVTRVEDLAEGQLMRLMQANFDSALDARYAVARDIVWSVFIHPLSKLDDEQFVLGLGQTVNVAETFGGSYSSGALVYGGGDSGALERKRLLERLKDLIET